jgi:BlaR1 peptidase M56
MHFLTQSALLKALGWSLLNSLWQMGLLWLSYQLLIVVFSKVAARIRHGLALGLLGVGSMWAAATFVNAWFFMDGGPGPSSWLTALLESYPERLDIGARWFVNELLPWCTTFYLLTLGGLLVRYSMHYSHCRRLNRKGLSKAPARFRLFTETTGQTMSIRQKVTLALSDLADTPMTLGFLKPVILLPVTMISNLTPEQVEAILVHELAHIARKDYLLHLAISIMELLFFFNPFARLLIGHLKKEREHSCDDMVLQFQYDPHSYVCALLSLARQHRQGRLALAATGEGNQLLLQRARRILQQRRIHEGPGAKSFFLVLLALLIMFFTVSGPGRIGHSVQDPFVTGRQYLPLALQPTGPGVQPPASIASAEAPARPIVNVLRVTVTHRQTTTTRQQTASIIVQRGRRTLTAGSRTSSSHDSFIGALSGDGDTDAGFFTTTDFPDTDATTVFAGLVDMEDKDFSIGQAAPAPKQEISENDLPGEVQMPYVPNSSFLLQYTDTCPPEQRLALLQELTERQARGQFLQLQRQMTLTASRERMKQLLKNQQQLRLQYQRRLEELHRQLQRAGVRLTTVYI